MANEWPTQQTTCNRCLLGEADGALYMAFMGTKQRRDLVTNAQVLQEPIWPEDLTSDVNEASQVPCIRTPRGFSLPCHE